ncbi:hypothetical protein HBP99_13855 [Listeria booriae]|uniref:hypothetical protein n=1 Tax=Listeria booriae TaxID=1552123 RepID=UPI001628353E|nr:hypothetical protein [Listeria booriae]MBC2369725.1 hypothetical protein [Listeria booriae]
MRKITDECLSEVIECYREIIEYAESDDYFIVGLKEMGISDDMAKKIALVHYSRVTKKLT